MTPPLRSPATPGGWLNGLDYRRWRMLTAARVFTLAAILGLSASAGTVASSSATFLALCVVAALMSVPLPYPWLRAWMALAEGALAALVLGSAGESAAALLPYLVVPPLAAGLLAGRGYAVAAVVTEVAAVIAAMVTGHSLDQAAPAAGALAPWLVIGCATGMLGAWVRDATPADTVEHAGYESAHRLLEQLRAVSRRLSSGLDTHSLAKHTLTRFVDQLTAHRAVLLVCVDGDACVPLSVHGAAAFDDTPERDATVRACWSQRAPAHRRVPSGLAQARSRIAFPMQVGARMIGALVVDRADPVDPDVLRDLQRFLDEQALKLDSALLFEEVRALATLEERHRLAREIHDGVAQEIASLGYLVDSLHDCSDMPDVRETAADLRQELSRIVSELRLSIFDLRSGVNHRGGLGAALSDYAREVGARSGIAVHIILSEHPRRLPAEVETQLLRIAQEAITNARKHSRAANLWVTLNADTSGAELVVEDDGIGHMVDRQDHFGLAIMRERAERVGARLIQGERPAGGSRVSVLFQREQPFHHEGAHDAHVSLAR